MSKVLCHRCGNSNLLIIFSNGWNLCPVCKLNIPPKCFKVPTHAQIDVVEVHTIDIFEPLDLIIGKLIAFFITNGMNVTDVAKQLGITRSTVYTRLKKSGLLAPRTADPPTIIATDGDMADAGFRNYRINKVTRKIENVTTTEKR